MAATVLNSKMAVAMSLSVVRAFVRLREMLATNRRLAAKINELEREWTGLMTLWSICSKPSKS
jgi:predicted membrane protein